MGENLEKQNNTNPQSVSEGGNLISLKGMFQNWYLDYASSSSSLNIFWSCSK